MAKVKHCKTHEIELSPDGSCTYCALETILREEIPGYNPWDQAGDSHLDHAAALAAINWIAEHLKHVEGSARGEPFVLRRWQVAIVGCLFGFKRIDDAGRVVRRFRKAMLLVARGNGKTPLAAAIVLYALYEDGEPGAQCYLAAGQADQAAYLFRNAAGFIDQDEELTARSELYRGDQNRSIVLTDDIMSFCKVVPGDGSGRHGGIPHITVVDELHVVESRGLLDAFETGMAKMTRAQPMLVLITTAANDKPCVCNEEHDYARAVRDNGGDSAKPGYDPAFLPVLFEMKPEDDYADEANWPKSNPNLDVSVSREQLRKAVQKAKEFPVYANEIKRLHFNIRTSQDVQLIPLDQWDKCCDPTLDLADFKGKPCFLGLDLSSKEDLTSLYAVFPEPGDRVAVFGWSWCPAEKVREREQKKRVPYGLWAREGRLIETPGASVDYGMVREKILWAEAQFDVQFVYADPHGARETATILMEGHGFQDRFVEFTQSMQNLSAPTKDLIFRVKNGTLRHDGNPVTRWAVGNVAGYFKGKIPSGESLLNFLDKVPIMPSKQSSADKIDPVAAIVNALAAKASHPVAKRQSIYATRGMLTVNTAR